MALQYHVCSVICVARPASQEEVGPPEKQTATMAPGSYKRNHQKRPVSKPRCWNVQTMITGLSASLHDIKDSKKTAVIDNELRRLNVDIAALQET